MLYFNNTKHLIKIDDCGREYINIFLGKVATGKLYADGTVLLLSGAKLESRLKTASNKRHLAARDEFKSSIENFVLKEDILLKSPTVAASFVILRNSRGYVQWTNEEGDLIQLYLTNKDSNKDSSENIEKAVDKAVDKAAEEYRSYPANLWRSKHLIKIDDKGEEYIELNLNVRNCAVNCRLYSDLSITVCKGSLLRKATPELTSALHKYRVRYLPELKEYDNNIMPVDYKFNCPSNAAYFIRLAATGYDKWVDKDGNTLHYYTDNNVHNNIINQVSIVRKSIENYISTLYLDNTKHLIKVESNGVEYIEVFLDRNACGRLYRNGTLQILPGAVLETCSTSKNTSNSYNAYRMRALYRNNIKNGTIIKSIIFESVDDAAEFVIMQTKVGWYRWFNEDKQPINIYRTAQKSVEQKPEQKLVEQTSDENDYYANEGEGEHKHIDGDTLIDSLIPNIVNNYTDIKVTPEGELTEETKKLIAYYVDLYTHDIREDSILHIKLPDGAVGHVHMNIPEQSFVEFQDICKYIAMNLQNGTFTMEAVSEETLYWESWDVNRTMKPFKQLISKKDKEIYNDNNAH